MNWIFFVGGKTGGHILPALTLSLEEKRCAKNILMITTKARLDTQIIADYPHVDRHVTCTLGSSGYPGLLGKVRVVWDLCTAFFYSLTLLLRYRPESVTSTGGILSLPVSYAAWLLRIPVIVYELNAVPGRAVRMIAPCAREVRVCFPHAQQYFKKSVLVEYPVRFTERDMIVPQRARQLLGLSEDVFTLFVSGGSQGSRFINAFVSELLSAHPSVQVIHQTGVHDVAHVQASYARMGIQSFVFAYNPEIALCYAAADRIIARAGAGSLFEILFFKKLALIIPLITKTTDHQYENARDMCAMHPELFVVCTQNELARQRESIEKFLFSSVR